MAETNYQDMSKEELLNLADDRDIPVNSDASKDEIIRRIELGKDAAQQEDRDQQAAALARQQGRDPAQAQEAASGEPPVAAGPVGGTPASAAQVPLEEGQNAVVTGALNPAGPVDPDAAAAAAQVGQATAPPAEKVPERGRLGSALQAFADMTPFEIEQLGVLIDKMRGRPGKPAPKPGPSVAQIAQDLPIDRAHTKVLKVADVERLLAEAGHDIKAAVIPASGWVVRRAASHEDGYHAGQAYLSVVTTDGRRAVAPIDGLEDDDYDKAIAERQQRQLSALAAAGGAARSGAVSPQ